MQKISGPGNWLITYREQAGEIEILRAHTCDRRAVLPDTIFGKPVTALGDHAMAPDAKSTEGEELCMNGVPCGDDWDNRKLEELTLPFSLKTVEAYAFYNCRSLQTLHLCDGIGQWGGGALMNCHSLSRFYLTRTSPEQGDSLAVFCDELSAGLDVTIREYDGGTTRLFFPDFIESYEENCPAHHFDYNIYGGGHPYHHVFRDKKLFLRDYDSLWAKYLRTEHEPSDALKLAWFRLRWPTELAPAAEEQYWDYFRQNAREALLWQLPLHDGAGLAMMLKHLRPSEAVLAEVCEEARRVQNTEAVALLLQRNHAEKPKGLQKTFDL